MPSRRRMRMMVQTRRAAAARKVYGLHDCGVAYGWCVVVVATLFVTME